jgi:hypothetical protein
MGRKILGLVILCGLAFFSSCKNTDNQKESKIKLVENKILQQQDGTISLKVDKADCYQDKVNPSTNTAEWNVVVSKSGRFNVWLSSATKDTTDLKYNNSVRLSILDNRIEAHPACDKIIYNSTDVSYPYFRADSFIGSLYIQDTGLYNIQIISEKIVPKDIREGQSSGSDNSKLLSVFLTPAIR